MSDFSIRRGEEVLGPLSAEALKVEKVRPGDLVRHDEDGAWLSLRALVTESAAARVELEEALEPDEPPAELWQKRSLVESSWVVLLLAADALWIIQSALYQGTFSAWTYAGPVVTAQVLAAVGLVGRRPWAWLLGALVTATVGAWMLAPLIDRPDYRIAIWLGVNVATAIFLVVRRPRGPALHLPRATRRLLLAYGTEPEAQALPLHRPGSGGPAGALMAVTIFFGLVLVGIYAYHRVRFPELALGFGLIPRGGGILARVIATSVYGLMVLIAWLVARRAGSPLDMLGLRGRRAAVSAVLTGARLFLALYLVLLGGRWLLRSAEVVERRLEEVSIGETNDQAETDTGGVREAIEQATRRAADLAPSAWAFLVALLLGPLCEEIFFRGLVFGSLRRSWPFWAAALVSAACFAAAHGLGARWGAATPVLWAEVAAGGIAAAYAYDRTGSLAAPICLHVLWNAAHTIAG